MFSYMSRGKKEWNCWSLPYIFGSRDYTVKIILKMIMNTITQIQDKTTKNLKDESKTNRR